jgi:hypothetical protein
MINDIINNSENYNYLVFYMPLVVLTFGFLILCNKTYQNKVSINKFWGFSLVYLLIMRLQDFQMPFSMNPDEEQWIICANSLVDSPSIYFSTFFICDFTRFLGILPLAIFRLFSDYLSYEHARILNIIFFYLIIRVQFKLLSLFFEKKLSLLVLSLFIVMFASANHYDLINYNSEISAVLIFSICIYLFAKYNQQKNNLWSIFLIGFLCAMTPFAKEQGALITASTVIFFILKLLSDKNYKGFCLFIAGGISFIFIYLGLLTYFFDLNIIYQIITTGLEYTSQSEKAGIIWQDLIIKSLGIEFFNNVWFIPITLFLLALIIGLKRIKQEKNQDKIKGFLFFSLLSFIIILTINISRNPLFHYMLFLLINIPWIIAYGFEKHINKKENRLIAIVLCLMIFIIQSNDDIERWRLIYVNKAQCKECFRDFRLNDSVNQIIQKHRKDGDSIVIWGWENFYIINNRLHRGSSYLYPEFAMKKYTNSQYVIQRYIDNISKTKPAFFVELVGKGRHWFTSREKYNFQQNAPDLYKKITTEYLTISEGENYRIFKRKS